jgi:hypothetical protein
MQFQELSKLKLQVTLESNFLNWSTRFQVFSKQSMHNKQENMTVGVHLAQYHQLWFCRCPRNKVACKLVAYQRDGHRLPECRLQSSQSRKLIANLQNTESWELSTLYWKPSNLAIYLPRDFSVDDPLPETTQHRDTWLMFYTLHTTLDSTVQWSCMKLGHWFYYKLPGETLVQNSKAHGTSSNFNKPPTYVTCTRRFPIRNSNRHISETSCTSRRAIQREKGIDWQWPERRKMSEEKRKSLQVAGTVVPRQKAIGCCARERLHLKVTSWGGGKRSQIVETPHCSFLPSLAASCVGVFLFFWKF